MARLDMALQGAAVHGHILRLAVAAIDHGRDLALQARLIGRALARAATRFHLKFLNLRHFPDPSQPGNRPQASRKGEAFTGWTPNTQQGAYRALCRAKTRASLRQNLAKNKNKGE